jgi:anti-sigma B factor antagonist
VVEGLYPVEWAGGQAVVALPEHIGISNAGQVREELLSVINQGATTLIADMTATISCDRAGADAVTRAWQRAAGSGTELRLVVTAQIVARVLSLSGLDRLMPVYPSLEAATDARTPAAVAALSAARARRAGQPPSRFAAAAPPDGSEAAPVPAAELLDALPDAVALPDAEGTVVAASARMDAMFGYASGEPRGLPAESLELMDTVITDLFHAGLSLQTALDLPADAARQHIEQALADLDGIIRQIRDAVFTGRVKAVPPRPVPPVDSR